MSKIPPWMYMHTYLNSWRKYQVQIISVNETGESKVTLFPSIFRNFPNPALKLFFKKNQQKMPETYLVNSDFFASNIWLD